jgi:hypothetical protein
VAFASASRGPGGPGGGPDGPQPNGPGSSPTSGAPGGGRGGVPGGIGGGPLGGFSAGRGGGIPGDALGGRSGDGPSGPSGPTGSGGSRGHSEDGKRGLSADGKSALSKDGKSAADKDEAKSNAGGQHEAREGDPDHSGASVTGEDAAQAVESSRANPWDRDAGTIGGFGLGGRNGRFLFGGRTPADEHRPGLNGHSGPELNGRPSKPDTEPSTVDGPAAADAAEPAEASDENGRDDMNGRAGFTAPGDVPAEEATTGEHPGGDPRRQATGWASVPTSTNPIVTPTSGAPVSAQPVSPGFPPKGLTFPDGPAPKGPGFSAPSDGPGGTASKRAGFPAPSDGPGAGTNPAPNARGFSDAPTVGAPYGQPPSYVPALPDPAAGPVSGVPAPRAAAAAPADAPAKPDDPAPLVTPPVEPIELAPVPSSKPVPSGKAAVRTADDDLRGWDDEGGPRTPSPRRSASLEDAEPIRRGRRAAPDPDDEPAADQARPGDVAAGHIAFWDDDATRHFRAAWHEVKAEFVDDPERALTRAHDLLTDAVNELTEALLAERDELDPLRGTATPDTESMRMAMRGYREFLDRILAL